MGRTGEVGDYYGPEAHERRKRQVEAFVRRINEGIKAGDKSELAASAAKETTLDLIKAL